MRGIAAPTTETSIDARASARIAPIVAMSWVRGGNSCGAAFPPLLISDWLTGHRLPKRFRVCLYLLWSEYAPCTPIRTRSRIQAPANPPTRSASAQH
ncbi:hypothetical protein GCM10009677_15920 [Sphaerisporangium rubeum]